MSLVWLMLVMSLLTGITVNANTAPVENRGYIFVGDSRTVGMDSACDVGGHANIFVIAKVGQGYWWLTHKAVNEIENVKSEHPEYNAWTIVSNLGVNDVTQVDNYIEFYSELEDDFVFVSCNPVRNEPTVSNSQIDNFNCKMREAGFRYIDTNTLLRLRGFSTPDGLHYTDKTYRLIFSFIILELGIT